MKKVLMKRYANEQHDPQSAPTPKRMKTRSVTRKENESKFSPQEEHNYKFDRPEYDKEQERRRLAGVEPIIICMGGPYSDKWYPPSN